MDRFKGTEKDEKGWMDRWALESCTPPQGSLEVIRSSGEAKQLDQDAFQCWAP